MKCIWKILNKEDTFSLEENPSDFYGPCHPVCYNPL